jgi:dihydrofolate reductase
VLTAGLRHDAERFVFILTLQLEVRLAQEDITRLRSEPGKDIWLFGCGSLFRSLCSAQLVSTLEVSVIPILLGAGTPLLPPPSERVKLRLVKSGVYEKTGTIWMKYLLNNSFLCSLDCRPRLSSNAP